MKHSVVIIALVFIIITFAFIGSCNRKDRLYEIYETSSLADLSKKGEHFLKENLPDSALIYYSLVTNKYREKLPDSLKRLTAGAYARQGYIYLFYKNDYASSYSSYLNALDILDNINDSTLYAPIYLNLGNIFLDYKERDKMMEYYKKSFSHSIHEKDWRTLMIVLTTMMSYAIRENNPSLIAEELKVFDTIRLPATSEFKALRIQREAVEALSHSDYEKAISKIMAARTLGDMDLIQDRYKTICDMQISDILRNTGKYGEAIDYVKHEIINKENAIDIKQVSADMLAELYINVNEPDSALKYMQIQKALSDSLFKSQQYGILRDIGTDHDIKKLDIKIQDMESRHYITKLAFIFSSVGLGIFLILSGIVFYQNKKLRQRNLDLFRHNTQALEREEKERTLREVYERQIEELSVRSEVSENVAEKDPEETRKYEGSHLTDAIRKGILMKIDSVMSNEKEIVSKDFSLDRLAALVESNTSYVSQIINQVYGKNFNSLLGEVRIKLACARLCDKKYENYTIEGIANDLGFKSRTNFNTVFRKFTGFTPSEYRKIGKISEKDIPSSPDDGMNS